MDSLYPQKEIPLQDVPSSPWATRFPTREYMYTSKNINRSALAPAFPRIDDPKYYDQNPVWLPGERPGTATDEDQLFCTERMQLSALFGTLTWQIIALNNYARFSPDVTVSAGHRPIDKNTEGLALRVPRLMPSRLFPGLQTASRGLGTNADRDFAVYQRERIEVDEERWLPFLRKDRWFDWIVVTQTFTHSKAGRTWSVDDPKVWGFLRVSLELVNRILEALIEDKHDGDYWSGLEDIFGPTPSPNDSVLLSHGAEKRISELRGTACQMDHVLNKSPAEWRKRLITLLRRVIWGFGETVGVEGSTHNIVNVENRYDRYNAMITLTTLRLQPIFSSDMTLGELCIAQVDTALTIMHELMHAIVLVRYNNDNYAGNCLNKERSGRAALEPFLDGLGIAEMGHCMDQLFFGGSETIVPVAFEAPVMPLVMIIREFPWKGYPGRTAPQSPFLTPGAVDRVHHIPLTWASKMLAESFWKDPAYPKKSENFFHRNPLFISETSNIATNTGESQAQNLQGLPHSYSDDAVLLQNWNEKLRLWDSFRQGWYYRAKEQWDTSPWSDIPCRRSCERFALAFEKRDLIGCANIAQSLIQQVIWDQDQLTYLNDMPSPYEMKPQWTWHAIGLLMMASIPIIRANLLRGVNPGGLYFKEHSPSRAAAEAGHVKTAFVAMKHTVEPEGERMNVEPSKFYNQILNTGEQHNFDQFDCLTLIDSMLELFAYSKGMVHGDFLLAIMTAKNLLMEDRREIRESYAAGAGSSKWASQWFFKIPPYDHGRHQWTGQQWMKLPNSTGLYNNAASA
ncbi:hypothetical protein F5Y12DRAFT_792230 [Xylaria sp. FL1777]|nr:hypothetical protein F5Y12DRAFT_792230 [Xylaria sp. FL1777]